MSDLILEVRSLHGGYEPTVNILNGIDLCLKGGEILGVIGLNGSGKSTLGRALVNALPYESGSILFRGKSLLKMSTDQIASQGVKMMMQGGRVFMNLSVWQNIELGASANPEEFIKQYADKIPLFNKSVKELKNLTADKLSGGQRHQLALAMTIASRPSCIILDEPSAGLSPQSVEAMYEILHDIHKESGMTIILIEQNISKALSFADRSILINQGKIVHELASGNLEEVEKLMFNI